MFVAREKGLENHESFVVFCRHKLETLDWMITFPEQSVFFVLVNHRTKCFGL